MLFDILFFAAGFVGGMTTYRYMLKSDPAKLQQWVDEANKVADEAKAKVGK